MNPTANGLRKWLTPGLGIKRWLAVGAFGVIVIAAALAVMVMIVTDLPQFSVNQHLSLVIISLISTGLGALIVIIASIQCARSLLAPYRKHYQTPVIEMIYSHNRRQRGLKIVAIGGRHWLTLRPQRHEVADQ